MKNQKIPKFRSLKQERGFWDTHEVFEVLGEEGWQVVEAGTTQVSSIYIGRVESQGAMLYLPRKLLSKMGLKKGEKLQAQSDGKRLIIEPLKKVNKTESQ